MKRFPSRREVMQQALTASALAAAPTIVPARALGKDGATAPSERIVMGCIGLGGQGRANMQQFLRQDDCQVVAVCDVDAKHRANAAGMVNERYGNQDCKQYVDFREVCGRQDIDTMLIATPDHWHALAGIEAVSSGKDVYCEKPLTHTFEEGRALIKAIEKHNRIWQTGSQQRSTFNFRWAVELVHNGHIGKIKHIEVGLPTGKTEMPGASTAQPPSDLDYDLWCGPSEKLPYHPTRLHWNWRWHLSYGGGQLMDWINHHNDIAHWGMGWDNTGPVEVHGTAEFAPRNAVWNAMINYNVDCVYPDGTTTNISNKNPMGTKWIGEDGWVYVNRGKFEASNAEWVKKGFDRGPKKVYKSPGHHRNFLDCVKSRQTTICPAETSHRSCTPGHLGLVSMLTGRKIKFDPAKEQILNDPGATHLLKFRPRDPWKL